MKQKINKITMKLMDDMNEEDFKEKSIELIDYINELNRILDIQERLAEELREYKATHKDQIAEFTDKARWIASELKRKVIIKDVEVNEIFDFHRQIVSYRRVSDNSLVPGKIRAMTDQEYQNVELFDEEKYPEEPQLFTTEDFNAMKAFILSLVNKKDVSNEIADTLHYNVKLLEDLNQMDDQIRSCLKVIEYEDVDTQNEPIREKKQDTTECDAEVDEPGEIDVAE